MVPIAADARIVESRRLPGTSGRRHADERGEKSEQQYPAVPEKEDQNLPYSHGCGEIATPVAASLFGAEVLLGRATDAFPDNSCQRLDHCVGAYVKAITRVKAGAAR